MRSRILSLIIGGVLTVFLGAPLASAQVYDEQFYRGEVNAVIEEGYDDIGFGDDAPYFQNLDVELLNEDRVGERVEMTYSNSYLSESERLEVGDQVVVLAYTINGTTSFSVLEPYRLPGLGWVLVGFAVVVLAIAGWRGMTSFLGLILTLVVLVAWVLPLIAGGANPVLVSGLAAVGIAVVSLLLAHGWNRRTWLSIASVLVVLPLALLLGAVAVDVAALFGLGSEEATYLTFGNYEGLDLRGLLLGAMVIGALGVLDDVTTAQVATVEQLKKANNRLSRQELYGRGLAVGREHIASLVNTLVLAYVGAGFPVFLLMSDSSQPLWVMLNNEFFAEEVVRTLVGSAALIVAVPVATWLAARSYSKSN